MAYTQGTWKFYNAYGSKQIMFARLGTDDETILESARANIECVLSNSDDARLIAAAPKLLEAAERLLALQHPNFGGRSFPTEEDIEFARAAVASARGEA